MSHHQKNDAGFPTGGNSPKFTEDDERRVVHSVISAFVASSPHGLGASKYAPKNYVPPNWLKTKQAQQNKEKELQKAGPFTNTAKPPVNTENTKYAAADFDDTSAFLAAMNRNTTPANRNTVTANATSEISESKPKPALSTTSSKAFSGSSSKMGAENKVPERTTEAPEAPAGATRVVQAIGVPMHWGMSQLYGRLPHGGVGIKKILDTFAPGGPRIVAFHFRTFGSAVYFHDSLNNDPEWHDCLVGYTLDHGA